GGVAERRARLRDPVGGAAQDPCRQQGGGCTREAGRLPPGTEVHLDLMPDVWVLVDHEEGVPSKVSHQLLTAARALAGPAGGSAVAVFLGTGWERARDSVGRYGAARAIVCSSGEFAAYQTAPQVETLAALVDERRPWGVLFASTPTGKEIAARVGARLRLGVLADSIGVAVEDGRPVVEHAAFGGAVIVRKSLRSGPYLICLKANAV